MTSDPPVVADLPDEGEFFLDPVGANPPRWVSAATLRPARQGSLPDGLLQLRLERIQAAGDDVVGAAVAFPSSQRSFATVAFTLMRVQVLRDPLAQRQRRRATAGQ